MDVVKQHRMANMAGMQKIQDHWRVAPSSNCFVLLRMF